MFNKIHRHVILISGSGADTKSVAAIMFAMRMTGAVSQLIGEHEKHLSGKLDESAIREQVKLDLAKADGIIVMGNDLDIDPGDYSETDIHPKTKSEKVTPQGKFRAAYEYELIRQALKIRLPCFGVCGGMQRLNVLLGGSLHQHVPDLTGTEDGHQGAMGIAPHIPVQYVEVLPATRLAAISEEVGGLFTPQQDYLPPGVFMENSFHHQAIDRVGDGLIPCAFTIESGSAERRIVQAVEAAPEGPYKDQFLLGVQWHPEFGASDISVRSLQSFSEQAQLYAHNNIKNICVAKALADGIMAEKWKVHKSGCKPEFVSGKPFNTTGKYR